MNEGALKGSRRCKAKRAQKRRHKGTGPLSTFVTHGQLKEVARHFFDRLQAELYYPAGQPFPWDTPGAQPAADYAMANLGHAKSLFQFDLTTDNDNDGIPDWWEKAHGLNSKNARDANVLSAGRVVTNQAAFVYNLDPNDPNAQLPASSLTDPPVVITWISNSLDMSASTLVEVETTPAPIVVNGDFQKDADYRNPGGFLGDWRRWYVKDTTDDGWKAIAGYNGDLPISNPASRKKYLQYEVQQQINGYVFPTGHAHAGKLNQYGELDAHPERKYAQAESGHSVGDPIRDNDNGHAGLKGTSDWIQVSDHGIWQTVQLVRGTYALIFDYRGRPLVGDNRFRVLAEAKDSSPLVSANFFLDKNADDGDPNSWKRALVTFSVSGGNPSLTALPIDIKFDIEQAGADSYGVFIDNVILIPVEFITPAGDPVTSPVDAGTTPSSIPDGANEFTFESSTAGVLHMKVKAKIRGFSSMSSTEKAKFKFELDGIGNSTFAWGSGNTDGAPTVSGDILTATATYTNLPANNSDFGAKKARIMFSGTKIAEQTFEVFFMKDEKNHPGSGAGTTPNWYFYWAGTAVPGYDIASGTYSYASGGANDYALYNGNPAAPHYTIRGPASAGHEQYNAAGLNVNRKGIDTLAATLVHEKEHRTVDQNWLAGGIWNGKADSDGDELPDDYEDAHAADGFDKNNRFSFPTFPYGDDEEVYVEKAAYGATGVSDKDWANPGKQSKTQF
jgi:hypothetical protein